MNDLEKETLKLERIQKRKEYQRQWAIKNQEKIKQRHHERYLARRKEILIRNHQRHEILKNDPEYREKRRMYAIERRKKQREWFNGLKEGKKCEICGESRLPCLEYHHVDPNTKEFPISYAFGQITGNKERILNEIKKCIILCANCHRIEHSNERT